MLTVKAALMICIIKTYSMQHCVQVCKKGSISITKRLSEKECKAELEARRRSNIGGIQID